ncbi:MAG TPA: hypothetical protein PKD59_01810 [Miltoncostaeaceae bacterium]|nr:hypothetical protein [Miltoncostaeaceae bacterium]
MTPAEVACRPAALVGGIALSRTTFGAVIVANQFVRQPVTAAPAASIEVATRSAAGAWAPPVPAIAGPADLAGALHATRDRTAVPATVARGAQFNRVRVALVGPEGLLQRRIDGPARPTPPPHTSVRVLPLGPGARVALLLTPEPTLRSSRASILTLGP